MEYVVIVLVAALAGWWFYSRQSRTRKAPSNEGAVRLNGPAGYEFAALGVSRYRPALQKIYGDASVSGEGKVVQAVLVLDGSEAVRVEVDGAIVGHLPAQLAKAYRQRLVDAGHPKARGICKARINARSGMDYVDYAVRLDLPSRNSKVAGQVSVSA